jgi:hypothetical protein
MSRLAHRDVKRRTGLGLRHHSETGKAVEPPDGLHEWIQVGAWCGARVEGPGSKGKFFSSEGALAPASRRTAGA